MQLSIGTAQHVCMSNLGLKGIGQQDCVLFVHQPSTVRIVNSSVDGGCNAAVRVQGGGSSDSSFVAERCNFRSSTGTGLVVSKGATAVLSPNAAAFVAAPAPASLFLKVRQQFYRRTLQLS